MELLLWAFILIGNAGAIIVLSMMTAGGTSAMGSAAPGRVGRSISTPASRRTVRETLTSYSSHQANMPVTPSFQCTNSLRLLTAMTSINRPARIFAPL